VQRCAALGALIAGTVLDCGCASTDFYRLPFALPSAHWTIQAENAKPGSTDWRLTDPATRREIEGYASATSVDRGQDISIYVNTADPTFTMQFFRMGWYGGAGAREMMPPVVRAGIKQIIPTPDPETHLQECAWSDPYVLHIPRSSDPTVWPSGVYLVKLTAGSSGKQSYVPFVVRDDERSSDLLFQLAVTTDEAYNWWEGWSLYTDPQAYKVSFNRPYAQEYGAGLFFEWEYNMVRFLEREGYDVTYSTNVDTDLRGQLLLQHQAFLSVGHDEYWSWQMRDNVERGRDSGLNLGFFGGDASSWQIRFEPSTVNGDLDRTIVCYRIPALDPLSTIPALRHLTTTRFRDPPVRRPENALIGVMYEGWFSGAPQDIVITNSADWMFQKSGVKNGTHLKGLLGYELDRIYPHPPRKLICVAHSPWVGMTGKTYYTDMTYYFTPAGGTVVATGSMDWNWGLDDFQWGHPVLTSPAAQQITRNILHKFRATDPATIHMP
jgi:hypothetical protein